jgi:NAD dependent epimerase/dehydratase family enzyme
MAGLILFILDSPPATGPINAVAPQPVTNREFSRTLGRVLHRPSCFPTPRFVLRVMVGEAANVITTGQRVVPRRALELGYRFQYPELEGALRNLLNRPQA